MNIIVVLILVSLCFSYSPYGVHIWTGKRISKREFEITIQANCKNDVLTIFENKCNDCYFENKIIQLEKSDVILLEYERNIIKIHVNGEYVMEENNTNRCFFCIQKKFK